ncbi:anti-sigma factor domain-containing protein [Thermosediminibacter oceani]|uniref:RsgI N-terminal anti-sigma domain-containing protein n=1 Tax=Thermosediminibacter oceani (strain ATCC BAA-1034 / DSM 16646 / JW/IW-1228P) TaxID=555079 RepID=D9RZZ0_THEOJ|nr:anti-sigma factor domain-containing protein [Thermosediminibacter oceani]ADL08767.1 hypothetical protein Toce_2049 [Thermosediminibacter oceani DSM 16646]
MKGVIVDIEGEHIIVVTPRGDFKRIYNAYKGRQIGDEVDFPETAANRPVFWKIASLAAVFVILAVTAGYGFAAFFHPVTYVTMDVNPSVEMSLNRFNRVIDVEGLNDDGARLVGDRTSFRAKPPEKVVRMLLYRAKEQNLLGPDSVVMFTVSNVHDKKMPELEKKLEETARKELKGNTGISIQQNDSREVKVLVQEASIEKHQEAKKMGISQGKLLLFEKLKKADPALDVERIKKMRVREMLDELKAKTGEDLIEERGNDSKEQEKPVKDRVRGEIKKGDWSEFRGNPSGLVRDERDSDHFDNRRIVSLSARGGKEREKLFSKLQFRIPDSQEKEGKKYVPAGHRKNDDNDKKDRSAGRYRRPRPGRGR